MLKLKRILFFCWSVFACCICNAQPSYTFSQYNSSDGLSQKTIQQIYQDRKGVMWFATWDGLFKFDGYSFYGFKSKPEELKGLNHNRLDKIQDDTYGYLWVQNYNGQICRFNTDLEKFEPITQIRDKVINFDVVNADVWVTDVKNRLFRIRTDSVSHRLTVFPIVPSQIKAFVVNKIVADKIGNQWILTDKGVLRAEKDRQTIDCHNPVGQNGTNYAFYDEAYHRNTLYFAANGGTLFHYTKSEMKMRFQFPTHSAIRWIRPLTNGLLAVVTDSDGFYLFNPQTDTYKHYQLPIGFGQLKHSRILDVYFDKQDNFWIRTESCGVIRFTPQGELWNYYILKDKYGRDIVDSRADLMICEDSENNLWVHPSGGGLGWFDRKNNALIPFYNKQNQEGWNADNKVTAVYLDKQNDLWIGSYRNGLEKAVLKSSLFSFVRAKDSDPDFPGNNVRSVFQDRNGIVWTGNKDLVIRVFDRNYRYLGNLTTDGTIDKNRNDKLGIAYTIMQAKDETLYIGTKGNGLFALQQTSTPQKYKLVHYHVNPHDKYSLNSNEIYSLYEDRYRNIWIATFQKGVNILVKSPGSEPRFINTQNDLLNYPVENCYRSRQIAASPKGDIWVGTSNGLLKCEGDIRDFRKLKFKSFTNIPGDTTSLSNNSIHNICFTKAGKMFVSTFGGGLNEVTPRERGEYSFKSYTIKDGFPSDVILSFDEDTKGNLWCATEENLCRFTISSKEITVYSSRYFPLQFGFNEGAAIRSLGGDLLFCSTKGILKYRPESIQPSTFVPSIYLASIQIGEEIIDPNNSDLLSRHINNTDQLTLPAAKNGFTIHFSALEMKNPEDIQYAYRLVGFDYTWNKIGKLRNATYTNLPKGDYTLQIRSTNSDGNWVDNTRSLPITILPSFWETVWAYMLYVVAILLIIFGTAYILFIFFKLKQKVVMEQEIANIKLQYFTNISHELRTPLTLISAPIEQILSRGKLQSEDKTELSMVERNVNRMLRLVNQILDFRKIQNHKMGMSVQQMDIVAMTTQIMESFNQLAADHQMRFTFSCENPHIWLWVDTDKFEKILFNLISNAFKYTPSEKEIRVVIEDGEDSVSISVVDQGVGVSEEKQKSLFVRFESLAQTSPFGIPGTGIGLSLVKELVELHKGHIQVESRVGTGSTFTVCLLKGTRHFDESTEFVLSDGSPVNETPERTTEFQPDEVKAHAETMLIVEDNAELRYLICSLFSSRYNTLEACNGEEGYRMCVEQMPDMIISDVMMPIMDGIQMAKELRTNVSTCHIPIIFLTAKSTIESRIEGIETGADDYITKPFSTSYLKARVDNLIAQRKKLQAFYHARLLDVDVTEINAEEKQTMENNLSERDKEFVSKVMEFVEANAQNSELSVDDIASALCVSLSVLQKKLKAIAGFSPVELVREARMKMAAQLILKSNLTLSEITYKVGLSDPHYFSKCFKKQYGITPTEYREKNS